MQYGPYNTVNEARKVALQLSKKNPKIYYTLSACFGVFVESHKRLHVFAPSDSCYPAYWKSGKEKKFTEAQIGEDWRRTPTMS